MGFRPSTGATPPSSPEPDFTPAMQARIATEGVKFPGQRGNNSERAWKKTVRDQKREFIEKFPKERRKAKPRGTFGNGARFSTTGAPEIGGPQKPKGVAASLAPIPISQSRVPSNVVGNPNLRPSFDQFVMTSNPALAKFVGLPTTTNPPVAPTITPFAPTAKQDSNRNVVPPSQRAIPMPMSPPTGLSSTVPLPARPAPTPTLKPSAPAAKRGAGGNVVPTSQQANAGPVAPPMAPVSTLPYYVVPPSKQANTRPVAPPMAPIPARPSYLGPGGPPLPPRRYSEDVIQKELTYGTMYYPDYEAEDMENLRRIYAAPIVCIDDAPRVKQVKRDKDVETLKQVKRDEDVDMDIDATMGSMGIDDTEGPATQMPATGDTDMDVENALEADSPMPTAGQDIIWRDDEPVNTDDIDMDSPPRHGQGNSGYVQSGPAAATENTDETMIDTTSSSQDSQPVPPPPSVNLPAAPVAATDDDLMLDATSNITLGSLPPQAPAPPAPPATTTPSAPVVSTNDDLLVDAINSMTIDFAPAQPPASSQQFSQLPQTSMPPTQPFLLPQHPYLSLQTTTPTLPQQSTIPPAQTPITPIEERKRKRSGGSVDSTQEDRRKNRRTAEEEAADAFLESFQSLDPFSAPEKGSSPQYYDTVEAAPKKAPSLPDLPDYEDPPPLPDSPEGSDWGDEDDMDSSTPPALPPTPFSSAPQHIRFFDPQTETYYDGAGERYQVSFHLDPICGMGFQVENGTWLILDEHDKSVYGDPEHERWRKRYFDDGEGREVVFGEGEEVEGERY